MPQAGWGLLICGTGVQRLSLLSNIATDTGQNRESDAQPNGNFAAIPRRRLILHDMLHNIIE